MFNNTSADPILTYSKFFEEEDPKHFLSIDCRRIYRFHGTVSLKEMLGVTRTDAIAE